MSAAHPMLGIIAGSGRLPAQLVEHCTASGRPCFVLALEGFADISQFSHAPHVTVRLGAVGEAITALKAHHAQELVLAGHVKRPSMLSLRPDATGAKLLARLGKAFFAGDDALLKSVVTFLEEEGFKVVGANEVFTGLTTPEGALTTAAPSPQALQDIALGIRVARTLGALDIGQSVIVENGYVLGVEAAEGTAALIERCGKLRRELRSGVLIKCHKPHQETRVDLPAIGPDTVRQVYDAGLAGIAVEAGASLILDQLATIAQANTLGLFVIGVTHD